MKGKRYEEEFIEAVCRINRYLIISGIFFLIYFLLNIEVDIFLFFLSLIIMAFGLLSYRHVVITNRLAVELKKARMDLENDSEGRH